MSADDPSGAPSVTTMILREPALEVSAAPGLVVDPADHARIAAAVRGFGLSDPIEAWPLGEGLMNRNWRVCTCEGGWAVKQILDIDAEAARRQHRVTRVLAELGLPVPPPCRSLEGDSVMELAGGEVFAVLPWVEGVHRDGCDLDLRECQHLGGLLARIHQALGSQALTGVLAAPPQSPVIAVSEATKAKGKIDHYLGLIDARAEPDEFDHLVQWRLVQRRGLLERLAYLRPDDTRPVAPIGWVHGDFHDLNLLWSTSQPSRVAAVLDWDRLRCAPLAAELVRTATLVFGYDLSPELRALDLDRVAAFTAGYRELITLSEASLADAAHRLWWERVCDFWQLSWHYQKADHSCDHLFVSASALLAWWSDHRDTVSAAFTMD